MRTDGRKADELRKIKIIRNYIKSAEGSVMIQMGDIWVICTATVENSVPPFLRGKGTGWVTPILVTVGEQDFRVPINNAMEMWTYVQRLQVPGKMLVFPDANHWIMKGDDSRFWYGEVHAWLAKYLQ